MFNSRTINFLVVIIFVTFALSCNAENIRHVKFDKAKWMYREDPGFPPKNRAIMLHDLLNNHKLKGLTTKEVYDSIGRPDIVENSQLYFVIEEEYGSDIDPIYLKYLVLPFSKDSIITESRIKEIKK